MVSTPYDEVRYPGKFYPQSSAERLSTLARLHGLQPAPPDRCRVLELGCGDGGNLIPQAVAFPESRFVGIDLAASAIAAGQELVDHLGLRNIRLIAADIATYDPGTQPYDAIVAHGVLSWVPGPVRERLLAICGACLAPHGVAYVSYSALPGGYLRNVPRDLMRFSTRKIDEPMRKVQAARETVALVQSAQAAFGRELFEREMAGFEGKDYFLLHDLLADESEPLYFTDFMDGAAGAGLQFLSEAEISAMSISQYPPALQSYLEALPSRIEREQMIDFIALRRFRQTLLCRQGTMLDLNVTPERLAPLFFSTRARPAVAGAQALGNGPLEFRHPLWGGFRIDDAPGKALVLALARGDPRGCSYAQLRRDAAVLLGSEPTRADDAAMIRVLLSLFARDLAAVHSVPREHATVVGARPRVSALNRWLAARGAPVVNAALDTFHLPGDWFRRLVPLLDGTRFEDDLLVELAGVTPPPAQESLTTARLHRRLELLAENLLLLD